ncbi:retrotransposon protein, putative, ty1-copia subclass [Tanacetum coccineum]
MTIHDSTTLALPVLQGLREARKLEQGALYLYVGNGVRAQVEAIVIETFKVFKNEVENQLRKTIKALQSDQGGEYISKEFKDYLKGCVIDYDLESVACILNMVPTKKVDKTPYELWYGKVPNFSY